MPSAETSLVAAPPAAAEIVVRGSASPEQVAALVAVLSAVGGGGDAAPTPATGLWSDHARAVGVAPGHGRGAWRASAQPR